MYFWDDDSDESNSDAEGDTPLHNAAQNNDLEKVARLLSDGYDVNIKTKTNQTPLHYSVYNNTGSSYFAVAEFLLNNGAKVCARNQSVWSPFFYLVKTCDLKMLQLFLKFKAKVNQLDSLGKTLLYPASMWNNNVEVLQQLIDLGLDVNHRDKNGVAPLHYTCNFILCGSSIENFKCLLKNGADPNPIDKKGFTPLMKAIHDYGYNTNHTTDITRNIFNVVIKTSDFTAVHQNMNHFLPKNEACLEYPCEAVLEHLAKLETLNIPIHSALLDVVSKTDQFNKYYKQCQEELLRAKNTKLQNTWITFYDLLLEDRKKFKNYAGNADLTEDFKKSDCVLKFPIYGELMHKNMFKRILRRKLFDKSSTILSECLPIFQHDHLIVRDTLDYILSKKDLSKFCE